MNNNINLLDFKNKTNTPHLDKRKRPLRIAAISLLFAVSVFSIVIFILVAQSSLPEVEKQEKDASISLSFAQANIIKLALVKDRLNSVKVFIDKRPYYDQTLEDLQTLIPSGVSIDALSIEKNSLSLTLSSKSLLLLDNFINKLTSSDQPLKIFSNIKLGSLQEKDDQSAFILTVNMNTL